MKSLKGVALCPAEFQKKVTSFFKVGDKREARGRNNQWAYKMIGSSNSPGIFMNDRTAFLCLVFLLIFSFILVFALKSENLQIFGKVKTTYINADFIACSTNDPPGNIDPEQNKDVGASMAYLNDRDADGRYEQISLFMHNAYPFYEVTLTAFIRNGGSVPEVIRLVEVFSPPEIEVNFSNILGQVILPGEALSSKFNFNVKQNAKENHQYIVKINILVDVPFYGTIGYWKNWKRHKTYAQYQIERWLEAIDNSSLWLGPVTISGMEEILKISNNSNMREKFLAHYLATRLNLASNNFYPQSVHDVSVFDPGNYLGLSNPRNATLQEIIQAIESKSYSSLTRYQFEIMKNICDALNNCRI